MIRKTSSEHTEQCLLFSWAKKMEGRHPQLGLMFAIPNGGLRNVRVAVKLKKEGVKAGIPDIFLAVPRFPDDIQSILYFDGASTMRVSDDMRFGLFIEMKYGKNKPTNVQKQWLYDLDYEGYDTVVCHSFDEAKQAIIDYLGIEAE
jgi:hypothetical protein